MHPQYGGQWHAYQPLRQHQPKVNAGVLLGVTLWRLLIVAFALTGFLGATEEMTNPWPGLSQQASLFAAIVYTGLLLWPLFTVGRSHEPPSSWLRGGTAVLLMLVCLVYLTIMEGDLDETWSLFEHLLTPLVVFIDAAFVGRSVGRMKWWHPLSWIVFPLLYLLYYIADDLEMYDGVFRPDNEDFAAYFFALLGLTIVIGFVLYALGKLRGAVASGSNRQQPPPGWYPHHGQQQFPGAGNAAAYVPPPAQPQPQQQPQQQHWGPRG